MQTEPNMPNKPLHAITIETKRPEVLAEFYQKAFNLTPPKWNGQDQVGFSLTNNVYLGFDRAKESVKPGTSGPVLWFHVIGVEDVYTHMIGLGARNRTSPTQNSQTGETLAVLYDPDGNMIGLIGPGLKPSETTGIQRNEATGI